MKSIYTYWREFFPPENDISPLLFSQWTLRHLSLQDLHKAFLSVQSRPVVTAWRRVITFLLNISERLSIRATPFFTPPGSLRGISPSMLFAENRCRFTRRTSSDLRNLFGSVIRSWPAPPRKLLRSSSAVSPNLSGLHRFFFLPLG